MTKTITSQTHGTRYFLTIDETTGQASDCTCKDRQYRSYKPCCKHMASFNAEAASTFLALRQRFDYRLKGDLETRCCYLELAGY